MSSQRQSYETSHHLGPDSILTDRPLFPRQTKPAEEPSVQLGLDGGDSRPTTAESFGTRPGTQVRPPAHQRRALPHT